MTEHTTSDVIIVGGSCGGLACAHALLGSGKCRVTVLERAPSITAAGAVIFLPCKYSRHLCLAKVFNQYACLHHCEWHACSGKAFERRHQTPDAGPYHRI